MQVWVVVGAAATTAADEASGVASIEIALNAVVAEKFAVPVTGTAAYYGAGAAVIAAGAGTVWGWHRRAGSAAA